ncbi:MATE family efflux transporter [Christensenella timonensis]|uniref:MATE family efflux transporter n=1 Tax=Christensenella timonensis TaxID=1816678 RepID=UPI00082BB825|nr:MATE family efflux transporter [Christensenella timonensis]
MSVPNEKQFWKYILPSMLTMFLCGFYAIVDGFFVGQAVGDLGLAAINIAWPIASFLLAAGTGIGVGGSVVMSTRYGKNDISGSQRAFGNTFFMLLAASALMTVLFSLLYIPILHLLGARGELLSAAGEYAQIVAAGSVFQILGTGIAPLLRNKGKTIAAMAAMVSGLVTNIILDALFVMALGLGIRGAALATVIAQALVALVGFILLYHKKENRIPLRMLKPEKGTVSRLLKIGLSPFGMTFAPSIVIILANLQCLAYGGTVAVAAYSVLMYVVTSAQGLLQGVGDGVQPLLSYFNGAKNQKAMQNVFRKALATVLVLGVALAAAALFFRTQIPVLFGASPEASVLVEAALFFSAFAFPFIGFSKLSSSYFYAIADVRTSALVIYLDPAVLTPLFLFTLPLFLGITGIWLLLPCTQASLTVILLLIYRRQAARQDASAQPGVHLPGALQPGKIKKNRSSDYGAY